MKSTALQKQQRLEYAQAFRERHSRRVTSSPLGTAVLDTQPSLAPAPLRIASGLEPNTVPLTERQAYHLVRRTQYGATRSEISGLVGMPANQVVESLVTAALSTAIPADPPWVNRTPPEDEQGFNEYFELSIGWFFEMVGGMYQELKRNGFREKMTIFWHNHFVTSFFDNHEIAPIMYRYLKLLRQNAFGNFKDFVHAIGLDISMLFYLDGAINEVGAPNENYARELLELFTMGILSPAGARNYTETDITEIARALTGYRIEDDAQAFEVIFDDELHDFGSKTFLGRTGNFGYNDVIDIIFEERATEVAHFICAKLYREFVYETPAPEIVTQLAQQFVSTNFDIRAIVTTLLQSCHFFDEQVMGARIKSPAELAGGLLSEMDIRTDNPEYYLEMVFLGEELGQGLMNPPNVAGWPGYRNWITTATIPARWGWSSFLGTDEFFIDNATIDRLASVVHDANDALAVFRLPEALVRHFIGIPIENLSIETISAPWAGGQPIPAEIEQEPAYVHNLTKRMLQGIPWYEWDINSDEARYAIRDFLEYVFELPEFQLT